MIDSIGFKDKLSWVDDDAHPHSDAMHVVERWSRPDWDHLKHDLWVEDPKFYTKPWTFSRVYKHMAPGKQPMEYACNENNKDLAHGLGFGPHQPELGRKASSLLEHVAATISRYNMLAPGDRVIVAVSGGPDSVCLLHVSAGAENPGSGNRARQSQASRRGFRRRRTFRGGDGPRDGAGVPFRRSRFAKAAIWSRRRAGPVASFFTT